MNKKDIIIFAVGAIAGALAIKFYDKKKASVVAVVEEEVKESEEESKPVHTTRPAVIAEK